MIIFNLKEQCAFEDFSSSIFLEINDKFSKQWKHKLFVHKDLENIETLLKLLFETIYYIERL